MPKIVYRDKKIGRDRLATIAQANEILGEYARMGYDLTLRQLYYQFVARDLIPNSLQSYKRLGDIIDDGRMCGLIDWNQIEYRTRNLARLGRWDDARHILRGCAHAFHLDRWATQDVRVEVWCEKEALIGIFERICNIYDVPHFACRGYVSQSEMWRAAQRIKGYIREGKYAVILHFGDHDPSGIDMTRDITERLLTFGCPAQVERMALNMDQVEQYEPPPNPAKQTDSRFEGYVTAFGDESWELDALRPDVLNELVRSKIDELRDLDAWKATIEDEIEVKAELSTLVDKWDEVAAHMHDEYTDDIYERKQAIAGGYGDELGAQNDDE